MDARFFLRVIILSLALGSASVFATDLQSIQDEALKNRKSGHKASFFEEGCEGHFMGLPRDIWLFIISGEGEKKVLRFSRIDKYFWSLITGYPPNQIMNAEFTPPPYKYFIPLRRYSVSFRKGLTKTLKDMPHFFWFSFVHEIKDIFFRDLCAVLETQDFLSTKIKSITNIQGSINFSNLRVLLEKNPWINTLTLNERNIGHEAIKELAQVSTLTSLDLTNNYRVRGEMLKEFSGNATLMSLSLGKNVIGSKGLKYMLEMSVLTFLDLSWSLTGDKGAEILAKHPTLTFLNLWSNNIGPTGAEALVKNTTLTALELGCNHIGHEWANILGKKKLSYLNLGCGHHIALYKEMDMPLGENIYRYRECFADENFGGIPLCSVVSHTYFYTRYLREKSFNEML